MSSKPKEPAQESHTPPPKSADKTDKTAHAEATQVGGPPGPEGPPQDLNRGQVHVGETLESPGELHQAERHEVLRLHMDQIDAVATPQGVILFALTEGGDIWQLTSFGGQQVWTQIVTPEAPAEEA